MSITAPPVRSACAKSLDQAGNAWRRYAKPETGAPYVSSLVYANGLLFMANDTGIVTAADARSGERVWQHRVPGVFSASPIAAEGRVYFVSESGRTLVMRAARTAEVLAENDLGAHLVASPAASRGKLFLRSDDRLFAIGK